MLYFPQLASGAIGQYPIRKTRQLRTITNVSEDGVRIALDDAGFAEVKWTLKFENVSDEEIRALADLFKISEGRLQSFTFFDPTDNLLLWSEAPANDVWQHNSLLRISTNLADPLGMTRAFGLTNSGGADLSFGQTLPVPGAVTCCWSAYARAEQPATISLFRTSNGNSIQELFPVGPVWKRISLSGSVAGDYSSTFQAALPAGSTVEFFGLQVEAQPAASTYKQTLASGGVYAAARFDTDQIKTVCTAPNQHSCTIAIKARTHN